MKAFLKKAWPHVIVFCILIAYSISAHHLHTHFFQNKGRPSETANDIPAETRNVKFNIEGLKVDSQGTYNLSGWVFLTDKNISSDSFEVFIVLQSNVKSYIFPAESVYRLDVQEYFVEFNIDIKNSGFSALLHKDSIKRSAYRLGIILKQKVNGIAYFVSTGRCITRTPNQLVLEEADSEICQNVLLEH